MGNKTSLAHILWLHLAAKEKRYAGHDKNKDRDHLDHGKPVLEGAIVADGKKIDQHQEEPENHHPDHNRHAREPDLHVSSCGNHLGADGDYYRDPISVAGHKAGPAIEVKF